MALHISVFGSDLKLEGVTISSKPSMIIGQPAGQPSIVISQRWYEREGLATNEAIHEMLVDDNGDRHEFSFETFNFRHECLTLAVHLRKMPTTLLVNGTA